MAKLQTVAVARTDYVLTLTLDEAAALSVLIARTTDNYLDDAYDALCNDASVYDRANDFKVVFSQDPAYPTIAIEEDR
jgi:hypothetical protein